MLGLMLAAVLLPQMPVGDWQLAGADARRPHAMVVTSDVELTPGDAMNSAMRLAREQVRERLIDDAAVLASQSAPRWMPGFLRDRVVSDWLRRHDSRDLVQVLDRRTEVREYSYGDSYQTALLVQADPRLLERASSWMRRHTRNVAEAFLFKCGGIGALWGLLALMTFWMDRLTRGYMTWRLRALALGLASVGSGIVFLV